MKRLTALVIVLVLILTGCGKPPEEKTVQAPIVITLWHSYQGEALQGLEKAVAELDSTNPAYSLELVYVPADGFMDRVKQGEAAGKGPDLFLVGGEQLPQLYLDGLIQPLDKLFDASKYFKAAVEALSFNGSSLAIPRSIRTPLLAYNVEMAAAPPANLEQLPKILDGIRKNPALKINREKLVGLSGDLSNLYLAGTIFSAYGASLFNQNQQLSLDNPDNLAYLQTIAFLADMKAGAYDPGASKSMLATGLTPYALMESTEINTYKGLGKKLKFAPVPGPAGKKASSYVKGEGFAISYTTPFAKQAAEAASYLTSPKALELYSIPRGEYPANPESYNQSPLKESPEAQAVKQAVTAGTGYPLDSRTKLLYPVISQAVRAVIGGVKPEEAIVTAQDNGNKALSAKK